MSHRLNHSRRLKRLDTSPFASPAICQLASSITSSFHLNPGGRCFARPRTLQTIRPYPCWAGPILMAPVEDHEVGVSSLWSCIVCRNLTRPLSLSSSFPSFPSLALQPLLRSYLPSFFLSQVDFSFLFLKIHSFDACLGHVLPFYHSFLWRNFCGFAGVGVATITATRSMRNLWKRDSQPHCIGNLRDLKD